MLGQHIGALPNLSDAVLAETEWGVLSLHKDDAFITPQLQRNAVWELGETAALLDLLLPGMVFLDIGAHAGYFTLLGSRSVGGAGRVIAFEPEPRNYELLLANVWRNGLFNVECYPWAVSSEMGISDLYISDENTGDHRLYASEEQRRQISVRTVTLDAVGLVDRVDVVKIDVQGAEEAAVRGMEGVLRASPAVVLSVEFWPYGIERSGGDPRGVLDYYRDLAFQIRVLDTAGGGAIPLDDNEILDRCRAKGGQEFVTLLLERG